MKRRIENLIGRRAQTQPARDAKLSGYQKRRAERAAMGLMGSGNAKWHADERMPWPPGHGRIVVPSPTSPQLDLTNAPRCMYIETE